MNYVFISPNFPTWNDKWVIALKNHGVNVLGIGDTPYQDLLPTCRDNLTEYYYTPNLSDFDAMLKAVDYFQNKYGKIDFIESLNEWWLEEDAKLREWFNVNTGFFPYEMRKIKAKSAMKRCFEEGGAKTIRYILVDGPSDIDRAKDFIKKVGYPVFVKPDVGVGANNSFKLNNEDDLNEFLLEGPLPETYIMEEYIKGRIVSFDGICNLESDVVFCTTDHFPTPPADIVKYQLDDYYYTAPFSLPITDIDAKKFEKVGRGVVKAFGIKKRPFHIEFFVLGEDRPGLGKKGDFVGLECNMRAPGGYTPDMINFANSLSIYDIYADIVCYNENRQNLNQEKYYCYSIATRDIYHYKKKLFDIADEHKDCVLMRGRYPDHLADDMCNDFIFCRFKDYDEAEAFAKLCLEKVRD